ncbi:TRAP transporter substrate-binding protein DctP [Vibrio pelagius]|uniref:TRAP transporter substrate-binding protein DctP n=1 Tax=Vibrio pelagius TaxID=28169 RepID=UPI0021C37EAB|nr:TRAP transporter substrate-binding protein DctP [Vibrio pelagius]
MRHLKKIKTMGLTLILAFPFTSAAQTVLKLGHIYDSSHPWHDSAVEIAERVNSETQGRVKIEIFSNGTLGSEQELLEQVITGGVDIAEISSGQLGNVFKPMVITEMPYIFKDTDHLMRFFASDVAKQMFDDFKEQFNVHLLGSSSWGVRHVIGSKPVQSPEDMGSFKLRVPEQSITVAYAKAMGSKPTPVPYTEAYLAMRQNMVDGLENPLGSIQTMKFYEVGNELSLTGHVITAVHFAVNDSSLSMLSGDDRQVVLNEFERSAQETARKVVDADNEALTFMKSQGVNITETDREAFQVKTKSMSDDYAGYWKKYGDLYTIIQQL